MFQDKPLSVRWSKVCEKKSRWNIAYVLVASCFTVMMEAVHSFKTWVKCVVSHPRGRSSLWEPHVSHCNSDLSGSCGWCLCSIFFSILRVLLCWQEPCKYRAAKRRTRASTSVSPRMLLEQSTPTLQCCMSKVSQSPSWECNFKFHYHVHKGSPLALILN